MAALNPEPMFSLNNRNLKRATVAMIRNLGYFSGTSTALQ